MERNLISIQIIKIMITLKTLPQATAQEVFDQVINHLAHQKVRSIEEDYGLTCRYRYEKSDGTVLKCAAGCLIDDDEYYSHFERKSWIVLIERKMVPEDHQHLIADLQKAHDFGFTNGGRLLASSLIEIAKTFNLNFDIADFLNKFYSNN